MDGNMFLLLGTIVWIYSWQSLCFIFCDSEVGEDPKNFQEKALHSLWIYLSDFTTFLTQWNSHNIHSASTRQIWNVRLKLVINFSFLCSNYLGCNYFLGSSSLDIYLCESNVEDSINSEMGTIPVTSKSVKEVINYLDIRKLSGPDFILVVVLKNCEPKISYMLWTESCFPNCWKVLSMCLKLLKKGL